MLTFSQAMLDRMAALPLPTYEVNMDTGRRVEIPKVSSLYYAQSTRASMTLLFYS